MDRSVLVLAVLTGALALAFISRTIQYYLLPLWERPDSPLHRALRPSGSVGLGLGIAGTAMMTVGVLLYSGRKRLRALQGKGPIRSWLNVHIYLCLTGPLLVTFHSALKFRDLASYSYWSMMIVAASGIVGRWLYQQFPRTIKGTAMTLEDTRAEQSQARELLTRAFSGAPAALAAAEELAERSVRRLQAMRGPLLVPRLLLDDAMRPVRMTALRRRLARGGLPRAEVYAVADLVRSQVTLARRLAFLGMFRRLFLAWHVTHLIFFVAMSLFLVLHVGAAIFFGAKMGGG